MWSGWPRSFQIPEPPERLAWLGRVEELKARKERLEADLAHQARAPQNNEIDLISVGAHGAGFGMRALFGSNVDRVLRQASCPVLVARPLKPILAVTELELHRRESLKAMAT